MIVPPSRSVRGREWRIVVETCQTVLQAVDGRATPGEEEGAEGTGGGGRKVHVGIEVELKEVKIASSSPGMRVFYCLLMTA